MGQGSQCKASEKKHRMTYMPKNEQTQGRTDLWMNVCQMTKVCVFHCANRVLCRIYIFSIKKQNIPMINCPDPVYFNTPLLIIYLSAIETLTCQREIDFNGVYFLWFWTKYDT